MSYSIHDTGHQAELIRKHIDMVNAARIAADPKATLVPLEPAIVKMLNRYRKHCGNTSKYTPHQGKQECARRIGK